MALNAAGSGIPQYAVAGCPGHTGQTSFETQKATPRRSSLQASVEALFPKPAHSERVIGQ